MSATDYEPNEVAEFLLSLGRAQLNAGFPVDTVTSTLKSAAGQYGFRAADVSVFPGAVFLSLDRTHQTLFTAVNEEITRLDQSAAIADVAYRAQQGRIEPQEGIDELERTPLLPSRFPYWATLLGYGLVAAGFALVFRFSWWDPLIAGVLGIFVGVCVRWSAPNPALNVLMTPLLGAACAAIIFVVTRPLGPDVRPIHIVAASLIVLLPGAALTQATMEMASGHIISGGSRMLWAGMQLLLLTAGIYVGAQLAGVGTIDIHPFRQDRLPIWVAFAAVALYAVGQGLVRNMPRGSLWIIFVLLIVAQGIVLVSVFTIGAVVGCGVAAMVTLLAAILAEQRGKSRLPAISLFTPIFWLLVPGSVGVIGLVATVSGERGARDAEIVAGANLLVQAAAVIIAILIGMQVASLIGQARFWKSQSEREESPVA